MERNNFITVTGPNDSICTIFVNHITIVQKSTNSGGAYIYTASEKATILTKESYEDVIKMLGIDEIKN